MKVLIFLGIFQVFAFDLTRMIAALQAQLENQQQVLSDQNDFIQGQSL